MSSTSFGPGRRSRSVSSVERTENLNEDTIGDQQDDNITSSANGCRTKKRGRGPTRGLALQKYIDGHGRIAQKLTIVRANLEHEMSELHRNFRYILHTHYKPYSYPIEARKHRHKYVVEDLDWQQLCDRWETEEFKQRSEANLKQEEGRELNEIELFQLIHHNEKNGWVNGAEMKYDEMIDLKAASSQEGSVHLENREICKRVLGKRPKYVKGLGWGPRPIDAKNTTMHQQSKETNAKVARLRSMVESQQAILESQQATINEILRRLPTGEGASSSNMERTPELSNDN